MHGERWQYTLPYLLLKCAGTNQCLPSKSTEIEVGAMAEQVEGLSIAWFSRTVVASRVQRKHIVAGGRHVRSDMPHLYVP